MTRHSGLNTYTGLVVEDIDHYKYHLHLLMAKCLTVMPGGLDNPVAGGFFSKACWKGTNTRNIQ